MDLKELYSLRRNFTIVGLTGRTGSGCTIIGELLSKPIDEFENGLRDENELDNDIFKRKYSICKKYFKHNDNWIPFEIIKYKDVLLFYILNKCGDDIEKYKDLLLSYMKVSENKFIDDEISIIILKIEGLNKIIENENVLKKIHNLKDFNDSYLETELLEIDSLYFGETFKNYAKNFFEILEEFGYYKRTLFLHRISCNIRGNGNLININEDTENIENIYSIAYLINKIIKGRKKHNKKNPTKIVIDSLRNSLEIMFFKERYSAFYLLATKDVLGNSRERLVDRYKKIIEVDLVKKILKLDETEYKTKDFSKGIFSSPDVENCIQKSDYHIINLKKETLIDYSTLLHPESPQILNCFATREEQLMKFISLISQPGLITPSSAERNMQIANTAKLNSGCISRKVGAVITDEDYYVKSIGWNDVASGHTPCNLREVNDFLVEETHPDSVTNNAHYSEFEKGNSTNSDFSYKSNENPNNFKEAIVDYFKVDYDLNNDNLNGKNCSFCFKTIHNHYEGEGNQVHTRSLHAEENAMLQITKLGGQGAKGGILFTTASPCELCSKKAYQLGIKKIYFIDPYPGISNDQILKGGKLETRPLMIAFSGAIGNAYQKFYEPFMSYKDEISLTLDLKPKNAIGIQFSNVLKKLKSNEIENEMKTQGIEITDDAVLEIIKKGLGI